MDIGGEGLDFLAIPVVGLGIGFGVLEGSYDGLVGNMDCIGDDLQGDVELVGGDVNGDGSGFAIGGAARKCWIGGVYAFSEEGVVVNEACHVRLVVNYLKRGVGCVCHYSDFGCKDGDYKSNSDTSLFTPTVQEYMNDANRCCIYNIRA